MARVQSFSFFCLLKNEGGNVAKKILIVDDEPDITKVVGYRLKSLGYTVFTAVKGEEGLAIAKQEQPNLIIVDYKLPDMNADVFNEKLRSDEDLKDIPLILVSATLDVVVHKAKECGAVNCIAKPIGFEELKQKVEKYILE